MYMCIHYLAWTPTDILTFLTVFFHCKVACIVVGCLAGDAWCMTWNCSSDVTMMTWVWQHFSLASTMHMSWLNVGGRAFLCVGPVVWNSLTLLFQQQFDKLCLLSTTCKHYCFSEHLLILVVEKIWAFVQILPLVLLSGVVAGSRGRAKFRLSENFVVWKMRSNDDKFVNYHVKIFRETFCVINHIVHCLHRGFNVKFLFRGAEYFIALCHGRPHVSIQQYCVTNDAVNPLDTETILEFMFSQWDRVCSKLSVRTSLLAQTVPCSDMWRFIPHFVEHRPFTNFSCRECMPFTSGHGKIMVTPISAGT